MKDCRSLCLLILVLGAAAACSSGNETTADGGPPDTGVGGNAAGGTAGDASGGGGASQTGGLGGVAAGGSAGGGQSGGGAGGAAGGAPGGGGMAGGSGPNLEACFAGLRDGEGSFQVATKASADMKYRMRLALETADRSGTSGTKPWSPLRFGLETPDGKLCITDENALAAAYQGSRHNCSDKLTIVVGNTRYEINNPDTAVDINDPTTWVRPATLTMFVNGQMVGTPIMLQTVACHKSSGSSTQCGSGGPC